MTPNEFRLKRLAAKVSQNVLSRRLTKLGFKISQSTLYKIEVGDVDVNKPRYSKLLELLDMALSEGPGPDSVSNKGGPAFWKQ